MKNIYLVGFMGTGKTATAKLIAKTLNRKFLDLDDLITTKEKKSITKIFEEKGEVYFRKVEKEIVKEISAQKDLIVACGGGVVIDKDNLDNLKKSGVVICLTSTPEIILERTKKFNHRPLLNVDNPIEKIKELLIKREPFYNQAHYILDTTKLTPAQTKDEVLKLIKND
ncbi:MAG: shikimate kinase [Candidatus Omnitrophota bacterium]